MTWMLTATGAQVDLRFIKQESIDILDIAHHLAQVNRFTGACRRPYSVAEHSLLVCEIVEHTHGSDPTLLMAALMHDAHEAYTTDVSSPMKEIIGPAWTCEERRIELAVRQRFDLIAVTTSQRHDVRTADLVALSTEREHLMPPVGPTWAVTEAYPPITWWDFDKRASFTWLDWRQAFLDRFAELQFARANA